VTTHHSALDALGDATRRAVFELLRSGPTSVGELAGHLPVSRPAVSQHLRVLRAAGLVRDQQRGTRRLYSIDRDGLDSLRRYLEDFWDEALSAYARTAEREEERT
jgi:DNA-binding transcriptional ArsR family regulator